MSCERWSWQLWSYLDGELTPSEMAIVAAHVAECAGCQRALEAAQVLRRQVQSLANDTPLPAELQRRLTTLTHRKPRPRLGSLGGWAVAALAVAALVILWVRPSPAPPRLEVALADAHVHSLLAEHLVDVKSSDQHTVRPWFQGRLDYTFPVRDLSDSGFPLVGGRLDLVEGRPTAALVFSASSHVVNVFVWPEEGPDEAATQVAVRGFHGLRWRRGGLAWFALSDASEERLRRLAEAW